MHEHNLVAGYFRVSKARDDMHAPDVYRGEIERYCSYRELDLAQVYSDIDLSGWKDPRKRPSLSRLLEDRGRYSAIVIPKLSRFGRSMPHLIELFELFDGDGIALVFLDLQLDTSTSQGRLLRHIVAAFAQYESDVKSDYGVANHDHRVAQGRPNGPGAYGYRRRGDTLVPIEDEAAVVRDVFAAYDRGATMMSLARSLRQRGIPSPGGKLWTKVAVRNLLERTTYAGLQKRRGALVEANWEPLVPREVWERVQKRRTSVANRGICAHSGLYLLSGMITCEVCGSTLHHRTKQDRNPGQYLCRGTECTGYCIGGGIAEHRAEQIVVSAYLERYGATFISNDGRTSMIARRWNDADLAARRELLKTAIIKITLVRRPPGNLRGRGLPRGRMLRIDWSHHLDVATASVVVPPEPMSDSSKVCAMCGRRRHLSNFRREGEGRIDVCTPCVPAPAPPPVPRPRRKSWGTWTREVREWERQPEEVRGPKPAP